VDTDGFQTTGTQQGQPGGGGQYKFFFNIGSIDSFERKMEEAQEDLGWSPSSWVPITYANELSWQQELLRLAPTILLIAGYVWFTRRQLGGLGGQGPGGRGLFNVGKAQACKFFLDLPVMHAMVSFSVFFPCAIMSMQQGLSHVLWADISAGQECEGQGHVQRRGWLR
jgi:ATP-dependent Zn protease